MKLYQTIAIGLIIAAIALGGYVYVNRYNPTDYRSQGESGNPEAERDQEAAHAITWKTFVTLSTDAVNLSFDYPEGSEVEEGGSDTFRSYAVLKEGKWDVVTLIVSPEVWSELEASLLSGGGVKAQADGDRGVIYRGGSFATNIFIESSPKLTEQIGTQEVAVFLPASQFSEGYISVLIDIGADWNADVFDYFTRTFAFMMRLGN